MVLELVGKEREVLFVESGRAITTKEGSSQARGAVPLGLGTVLAQLFHHDERLLHRLDAILERGAMERKSWVSRK
jgi:hypothetical protein